MNAMMFLLCAQLRAQPPETRTISTELGELAYWDTGGEGPALLFVHGLPTSKELWIDVLPQLEGTRRVAVDLLDFGQTRAAAPAQVNHKKRAQGIEAVRAALGLEEVVLIAHDLGSSVAMDYMGAYGAHVSQLVLMSSPVYPDFQEPDVVDLVRKRWLGIPLLRMMLWQLYQKTLHKGLVNDARLDARQEAVVRRDYAGREGKERMWQNLSWGTPEADFADYPRIMKEITVPTLLLQGAQDPFIPMEHAHRLDEDIEYSRLIIIRDGAHFIPLDTPDQVAAAIRDFLVETGRLEEKKERGGSQ